MQELHRQNRHGCGDRLWRERIFRSRHEAMSDWRSGNFRGFKCRRRSYKGGMAGEKLEKAGEAVAPSHSWLGCLEIPACPNWKLSEAGEV